MNTKQCKKCGGKMENSPIEQTYSGTPDFHDKKVVTFSPGGNGKMIECLKCVKCGWSKYKCS